ncbi:MAG: type II toxin-antitoxin system Phd/YefM family antitoxin [Coxiellaceae bacterium]|nr:type II toxin-antitoxin system Phd/YefM family antitoxin [Coxiellaceae bacterium]
MQNQQRTIPAGEFKAKCLQLMNQVDEQHIELVITKRGVPIAKLVPVTEDHKHDSYGCLANTVQIHDDITQPIDEKWDADQ